MSAIDVFVENRNCIIINDCESLNMCKNNALNPHYSKTNSVEETKTVRMRSIELCSCIK